MTKCDRCGVEREDIVDYFELVCQDCKKELMNKEKNDI